MRREYDYDLLPWCKSFTINGVIDAYTLAALYAAGARTVQLFIVGGGGGGTGDWYTAGETGNGGWGGECVYTATGLNPSTISIFIGAGGTGATYGAGQSGKTDAQDGGDSYVTYNGSTYKAQGGWSGKYIFNKANWASTYPRGKRKAGGSGGGKRNSDSITTYYNTTIEQATAKAASSTAGINYSILGETGVKNPFDTSDNTYYGCGGGGGYSAHDGIDLSSTYPNYGGLNNVGGGRGGYGANNATTNKGADAVTYGSGGGGGAFSSTHTYSLGGNGKGGYVYVKIF